MQREKDCASCIRCGSLTYLKFEFLKLARRRVDQQVLIDGSWSRWVCSATPTVRVAILNLTEIFEFLRRFFPEDYSGLIVDRGGHIGTAALIHVSSLSKGQG